MALHWRVAAWREWQEVTLAAVAGVRAVGSMDGSI